MNNSHCYYSTKNSITYGMLVSSNKRANLLTQSKMILLSVTLEDIEGMLYFSYFQIVDFILPYL